MQAVDRIREVLELIVCPACRARLVVEADAIRCVGCGRRYPVEDGIPVLIVNRATESHSVQESLRDVDGRRGRPSDRQ
jgi:uncharacterized protein